MTFEDALTHMRKGRKIRCEAWGNDPSCFYLMDGKLMLFHPTCRKSSWNSFELPTSWFFAPWRLVDDTGGNDA